MALLTTLAACTSSAPGIHQALAVLPRIEIPARLPAESVAGENERKGTLAWRLDVHKQGTIEGFASDTSVAAGRSIALSIRSATPFRADLFRLGWYQGTGGRLVEKLPPQHTQQQPACFIQRPRNTVICPWRPSLVVRTQGTWVSGAYLVKLQAADGSEAYIPFVVREARPRAPVLVQLSVTTWQAYNAWGGASLYRRDGVGKSHVFASRSHAVSFDRPYEWPGTGQLFDFEYPLLYWLESRGENVAYTTDVDLDRGTSAIDKRRVFISAGHDEYYSTSMRRALERARDRGTSLMFMGANDVYRHMRFENGDRIEVDYKYAQEDPILRTAPLESTGSWRDPPLNQPEQALLGEQSVACPERIAPWDATGSPAWLFAGTGLDRGSTIPNLFGYEYDGIYPSDPSPRGLDVVAFTRTACRGVGSKAESTLYTASSGAYVFDAGSVWFDCALGPGCDDPWLRVLQDKAFRFHPAIRPDARVQHLIANLLDRLLKRR